LDKDLSADGSECWKLDAGERAINEQFSSLNVADCGENAESGHSGEQGTGLVGKRASNRGKGGKGGVCQVPSLSTRALNRDCGITAFISVADPLQIRSYEGGGCGFGIFNCDRKCSANALKVGRKRKYSGGGGAAVIGTLEGG